MADEQDTRERAPLEGEVIEGPGKNADREAPKDLQLVDVSVLGGLTRAEIDVQIATAHKFPRSITLVMRQIETFATLDVETAMSCFFRKPQRVKVKDPKTGREEWKDGFIEGPSIRFAETVMQSWGNGRVASRVTDQTEKEIEATGIFHDLESNVAWAKSVRVSLLTSAGRRVPEHLVTTLGNAAAAKAIRNAIMAGVPRGIWNRGYQAALKAAKGDLATLPDRRKNLFAKAAEENITQAEIFAMLGVKGEADIGIDQLYDAAGLLASIRDGESTVEELIAAKQNPTDERGLDEAFGRQGGAARATAPKPDPQKGGGKAAPAAAAGKPTAASATPASTASPGPSGSGPKPQSEPTGDGLKAGEQVDPKTGEVIDLAAKRAETAAPAAEVAQPAAEGGEPEVEQSGGESAESSPPADAGADASKEGGEIDTATFNGFARDVGEAADWVRLAQLVANLRNSEGFRAAPKDVRGQALLLAYNRALELNVAVEVQESDVDFYRLWLVQATAAEVRPRFRKVLRGTGYNALTGAEKDEVAGEVIEAEERT